MTEQSYVTDLMVVADGNPRGGVVTFRFTPAERRRGGEHPHPPCRNPERHRPRQDERRLGVHGHEVVKVTIGGCGG